MVTLSKVNDNKNLTIGIPVRNEAAALPYFLESLTVACKKFAGFDVEILFCINGCSDNSQGIVEEFAKQTQFDIAVVQSAPGKMQAQKEIIKYSMFRGPIAFLDADIILEEDCLSNLWNALISNDKLQIVFSKVYPVWKKPSFLGFLQKIYYERDDDVREARRYVHGRAYIARDRSFFTVRDLQSRVRLAKKTDPYDAEQLSIEKGPFIDDVYLSRFLADRFGINVIKEVQDAKLYFIPPGTIRDCYQEQKRLLLEIMRNDLLFPENAYTQQRWFIRKILWNKFHGLGLQETMRYVLYLSIFWVIKKIVRYRLIVGKKLKIGYGVFWYPLSSTKSIN